MPKFIKNFKYRIIPIVNPDGYEYVRQAFNNGNYSNLESLENYLKNRNANVNANCPDLQIGTNIRNNFAFEFGYDNIGSS